MKKYILKETELFAPNWEHTESFDTLIDAQARMNELYHQNAIEANPEAIIKAELYDKSALVVVNDGNEIEWNLEEIGD